MSAESKYIGGKNVAAKHLAFFFFSPVSGVGCTVLEGTGKCCHL